MAGNGNGGRRERNIRYIAGIPTDIEEAFGVNGLLSAVAVDVLRDAERNIGDVEHRNPLRHDDIDAANEGTNETADIELLENRGVQVDPGSQRVAGAPSHRLRRTDAAGTRQEAAAAVKRERGCVEHLDLLFGAAPKGGTQFKRGETLDGLPAEQAFQLAEETPVRVESVGAAGQDH